MRIALISCTSMKMDKPCKASEMYLPSPRFKLSYEYAKKTCDAVYIISAKYGLLPEDQIITPYNERLNDKSLPERLIWASDVIRKLSLNHDLANDTFLILAGRVYSEYLLPHMKYYELPLKGIPLGGWVSKLKELNGQSKAYLLHECMNKMPRYTWASIDQIPFDDGIYIMFDTGEKFYGQDRIVRIGTHNSDGRLKSRLRDHYLRPNKDGSIFRKNIGLAILRKNQHPLEAIWRMDAAKAGTRLAYSANHAHQITRVEAVVSNYVQKHIEFTCIPVSKKEQRLSLEDALIATLNRSKDFRPSDNWLGLHCPKSEIAASGLWNIRGLNGRELTIEEISDLRTKLSPAIHPELNDVVHSSMKKYPQKLLVYKRTSSSGKYASLGAYLAASKKDRITMTFDEIETILDDKLPPSASKHPVWWSNGSHHHSFAWLDAGYFTTQVRPWDRMVTFVRRQSGNN